jgi:hypothetical protein
MTRHVLLLMAAVYLFAQRWAINPRSFFDRFLNTNSEAAMLNETTVFESECQKGFMNAPRGATRMVVALGYGSGSP